MTHSTLSDGRSGERRRGEEEEEEEGGNNEDGREEEEEGKVPLPNTRQAVLALRDHNYC